MHEKCREIIREMEEVGMLPAVKQFRREQISFLRQMVTHLEQGKRFIIVRAPVGTGKSFMAAGAAMMFHKAAGYKTMITTPSRPLQRQYADDLGSQPEFKIFMGAGNYKCGLFTSREGSLYPVNQSPCMGKDSTVDRGHVYADTIDKYTEIVSSHPDQDTYIKRTSTDFIYNADFNFNNMHQEERDDEKPASTDGSVVKGKTLRKNCQKMGQCSYYHAREVANKSPAVIFSLLGFLVYKHLGISRKLQVFNDRNVHIFDEAHNLESSLRKVFAVEKSFGGFEELFRKAHYDISGRVETRFVEADKILKDGEWTEEKVIKLVEKIKEMAGHVLLPQAKSEGFTSVDEYLKFDNQGSTSEISDGAGDGEDNISKVVQIYKNCHYYLYDVAKPKKQRQYVARVDKDKLSLQPLDFGKKAERFWSDVNIFMSGTIPDVKMFCRVLGIPFGEVGLIDIPDPFPVKSHPIFVDGIDFITTSRATEIGQSFLPRLDNQTDRSYKSECSKAGFEWLYKQAAAKTLEIVDSFPELSGVGFTTGYTTIEYLKKFLGHDERFIFALDNLENQKGVKEHTSPERKGVKYLISAGIKEGYSFKQGMSRIQLIYKIPIPMSDMVIGAMESKFPGYMETITAISLQQQVGRSMRSADDFCMTVVLDKMFEKKLKNERTKKLYSYTFNQSIQWDKDWRNVKFDSENISY